MVDRKPLIVGGVVIATALAAALAFDSVYEISIRTRPPDPITAPTRAPDASKGSAPAAFTLRLVDSGGVGIPLAQWGKDYSHDRRTFREVILEEPPYVDGAAFERVELEWRSYVARMLDYGNNAIAVPLLLELMDFNRVNPAGTPAGVPVSMTPGVRFSRVMPPYGAGSGRCSTGPSRRGMQVFLDADMLTVTPPLSRALRRLAPDAKVTGIDTSNPAVWDVYRAGLEELFDEMPFIAGVVIRFGEGGNLYNTADWPYRSEMAVRSAASLQAMLRGLLPLFEARHKTLVLRSWTVGVGRLGRLHVDPRVYEAVLGDIESPALIVSTKFTAGDFFSYLPLNPTLAGGRSSTDRRASGETGVRGVRRVSRFSGRRTCARLAQPSRGESTDRRHLSAPAVWRTAPGRASNPLSPARFLAVDRCERVRRVPPRGRPGGRREPAGENVGPSEVRRRPANHRRRREHVLTEGRKAVLTGFYIRPFAEREVRVPGLELPPLMWIFEWDLVGGWHSLLSIVYRGSRDSVDLAIEEGYAAAASVRRARQQLQAAFEQAPPGTCAAICDEALRSLEYQETLFDTLAAWRETFLSYYRWLDTGDAKAWTGWRQGRDRFAIAAAHHVARFGNDLDFPAFDPASAMQAVTAAERGAWTRLLAAVVLIGVIALLASGSPLGRRARIVARFGAIARVGPARLDGGRDAVAPVPRTSRPWRFSGRDHPPVVADRLSRCHTHGLYGRVDRCRCDSAFWDRRTHVRGHRVSSRTSRARTPARRVHRAAAAGIDGPVRVDCLLRPDGLLVLLLGLAWLPPRLADDRRGDAPLDGICHARGAPARGLARQRRGHGGGDGRRPHRADDSAARLGTMSCAPSIVR